MESNPQFRNISPSLKSASDMYWFAAQYIWSSYPIGITDVADFIAPGIIEIAEIRKDPNGLASPHKSLLLDITQPVLRIPMPVFHRIVQQVNQTYDASDDDRISLATVVIDFDLVLCDRERGYLVRASPFLLLQWLLEVSITNEDSESTPQMWQGLEAKLASLTIENTSYGLDPQICFELAFPSASVARISSEWIRKYQSFLSEVWQLTVVREIKEPTAFGQYTLLNFTYPIQTENQAGKAVSNLLAVTADSGPLQWRWMPLYVSEEVATHLHRIQNTLFQIAQAHPDHYLPYLTDDFWSWKPFQTVAWWNDQKKIPPVLSIIHLSYFRSCPKKYSLNSERLLRTTTSSHVQVITCNHVGETVANITTDVMTKLVSVTDLWRYKFCHFYLTVAHNSPLEYIESYGHLMLFRESSQRKQFVMVRFRNQEDRPRDYPMPLQTVLLFLTQHSAVRLFSVEINRGIYREEDAQHFMGWVAKYWEDFESNLKKHVTQINHLRQTYYAVDCVLHNVITSGYLMQHYERNPSGGLVKGIFQVWQENPETKTFDEMSSAQLRSYKLTLQNEMDLITSRTATSTPESEQRDADISQTVAQWLLPEANREPSINNHPQSIPPTEISSDVSHPVLQPIETVFHLALRGIEDPARIPLQATFADPTLFQQNRPQLPQKERSWEIRYDLASVLNDQWMLTRLHLLPGQILSQVLINATGDPVSVPNMKATDSPAWREKSTRRFQRQTNQNYPQAFYAPSLRKTTLVPLVVNEPREIVAEKVILLYDSHPLSALTLDQRTKIQQVYQLEWREVSPASMSESFTHRRKTGYAKRLTAIKTKIAQQQQHSKDQSVEPFLDYLQYLFDSSKPHTLMQLAEVFQVPPSTIFRILTTRPQMPNTMVPPKTLSNETLQSSEALIEDYITTVREGMIFDQIKDQINDQTDPNRIDHLVHKQVVELLKDYSQTIIRCPADHFRFLEKYRNQIRIPAANLAVLIYESGVCNAQNQSLMEQIESILAGISEQVPHLLDLFRQFYPPQNNQRDVHVVKQGLNPESSPPSKSNKNTGGELIDTSAIEDAMTRQSVEMEEQLQKYSTIRNKVVDAQLAFHHQTHPAQPYDHLAHIIDSVENYFATHDIIEPALRGFVEFKKYLLDGELPALLQEKYEPTDPAFSSNLEALYDLYMAVQWMHHYFVDTPNPDVSQRIVSFLTLILHEDQSIIKDMLNHVNLEKNSTPILRTQSQQKLEPSDEINRVLPVKWDVARKNVAPELMKIMENMGMELQMPREALNPPLKLDKVPLFWSKELRTFKMKVANIFSARSPPQDKKFSSSCKNLLAQIPKIEDEPLFQDLYLLLHPDAKVNSITADQLEAFKTSLQTFFTKYSNSAGFQSELTELGKWIDQYLALREELFNSVDLYPLLKSGVELLYSQYFYRRTEKQQGFICVDSTKIDPDLTGLNSILNHLFGFEFISDSDKSTKIVSKKPSLGQIGTEIRDLFLIFLTQYDEILQEFHERAEKNQDTRYYTLWKDRRNGFSGSLAHTLLRLCYRRPLGDLRANSKNAICFFKNPDHTDDIVVFEPTVWENEQWQKQWTEYLQSWVQAVFEIPTKTPAISAPSSSLTQPLTKTELTQYEEVFDDATERGLIRAFKSFQLQDAKEDAKDLEDEEELEEEKEEQIQVELDQEIGFEDLEDERADSPHSIEESPSSNPTDDQEDDIESADSLDNDEDKPENFKRNEIQYLSHHKLSHIFQYCSQSLELVTNFMKSPLHPDFEILAHQYHRLLKKFCETLALMLKNCSFPLDFSHFAVVNRVKNALNQYENACQKSESNQNPKSRKNIIIQLQNHIAKIEDPAFQEKIKKIKTNLWHDLDSYTWNEANLFGFNRPEDPKLPLFFHSSKILAKAQEWLANQQEILGKISQKLQMLMDPTLEWGNQDPNLLSYANTPKEKNEAASKYFTPLRHLEEILTLPITPFEDTEITTGFEIHRDRLKKSIKKLLALKETNLFAQSFPTNKTVKQKDREDFDAIEKLYTEIPKLAENFKEFCQENRIYSQVMWPRIAPTALQNYLEKYQTFKNQEATTYPQYLDQLRKDIATFRDACAKDEAKTIKDYRPIIYLIRILKAELKELQHKAYLLFVDDTYPFDSVPFNNTTLKIRMIALGTQNTATRLFTHLFEGDLYALIYSTLTQVFAKDPNALFSPPLQSTFLQKQHLQKKQTLYSELKDLIQVGTQELLLVLTQQKGKLPRKIDFQAVFGHPFDNEPLFAEPVHSNLTPTTRRFVCGKILDVIRVEKRIARFISAFEVHTIPFPSLAPSQFYRWKNLHHILLREKCNIKSDPSLRSSELISPRENLNSVFRNINQLQWMTGQITRWSATEEDTSATKETKDEEPSEEEEVKLTGSPAKISSFYKMTNLNPNVGNFTYIGNDAKTNLHELLEWYNISKTPEIITKQSESARKKFALVRELADRYHLTNCLYSAEDVAHLKELVQADLRLYESLNLSYAKSLRLEPTDFTLSKWNTFQDVIHAKTKSKTNKQTAKFVATSLKALLRRPAVGNCSYLEIFARQLNEIPVSKEFPEYTENTWIQRMDRHVTYGRYYVIEYIRSDQEKCVLPEYYCIYSIKGKASRSDSYLFFGYHLGKQAQNSDYYKELQKTFFPLPPDPIDAQYKILRYDDGNRTTPIVGLINEFVAKFAMLDRHLTMYKASHEILYNQAFQYFDFLGILQQIMKNQPITQQFTQQAITDSIQSILTEFKENEYPNLHGRIESITNEIEILKLEITALKKVLKSGKKKNPIVDGSINAELQEKTDKLHPITDQLKTLQKQVKDADAMEQDVISGTPNSMLTSGNSFASLLDGNLGPAFQEKIFECLNQLFANSLQDLHHLNPAISIDQIIRYLTDFSFDKEQVTELKSMIQSNPRTKPYWVTLANYRTFCEYSLRLRIIEAQIRQNWDPSFALHWNKSFIEAIFQIIQFIQSNASRTDISLNLLFPAIGELLPEMFFTLVQITCEIEDLDAQDRHSLNNAFKFPNLKLDADGNLFVLQPFTRVACTPTFNTMNFTKIGGDQGVKTFCTTEIYSEVQQKNVSSEVSAETTRLMENLEKNGEQITPILNPYPAIRAYRQNPHNDGKKNDWMDLANAIGKWEVRKSLQRQRTAERNRTRYQHTVRKRHLSRVPNKICRAIHHSRGTRYGYAQQNSHKQKNQNTSTGHFMARNFIRFAEDANSAQLIQLDSATLARYWKEWFGTRPFAQKEMLDADLNRIREDLLPQVQISESDNQRIKEFATYFEKHLISDNNFCKRPVLIENFILEQLKNANNQCCRISLEDLRRYRAKAGESFVVEKANWLRGKFPKYVKDLAQLKSLYLQLIPPEYTSKIANSTGHEGIKGFMVKIFPLFSDRSPEKASDEDFLIFILDSGQIKEEKTISSIDLQPLNSFVETLQQTKIPIDKIMSSTSFTQLMGHSLVASLTTLFNQFLNKYQISPSKSGKSLFQDAGFISDYPLTPIVRKKIIRQYRKENCPSGVFFVPAGAGNLLGYKNNQDQISILDRDVNAARNIAQYCSWNALRDICQLQIDRLIKKNLKGDQFEIKYTGSISKAQSRLQAKTKDAFTKLIKDYQFQASKLGNLRDHFELVQMKANPRFITQFVETMEQAFFYMIPRTKQKISSPQWADEIHTILNHHPKILEYSLQATQWDPLTSETDPNNEVIFHYLKSKAILTEDWPVLLHASSEDPTDRRLSQFITGMWRGMLRSGENPNFPEKPIRLTALLRAVHKEIFRDSSSVVKKKAMAQYILNLEKWIVPLIKEIPDPPP